MPGAHLIRVGFYVQKSFTPLIRVVPPGHVPPLIECPEPAYVRMSPPEALSFIEFLQAPTELNGETFDKILPASSASVFDF